MRTDPYVLLCEMGVMCDGKHANYHDLDEQEFYTYSSRIFTESHTIDDNTKIRTLAVDDDYDTYDFCIPCFQQEEDLLLMLESSRNPCLFCKRNSDCNQYICKTDHEINQKEVLVFCRRCRWNGNWKKIFIKVRVRSLSSDDRFNGELPTLERILEIKRSEMLRNFNNLNPNTNENPFL